MLNKEPLLNLVRTNSVSRYLARRSQNQFIPQLRTLLNDLGYGAELQWTRLGTSDFFGNETATAVRSFAQKNRLDFDGVNVTAPMLIKMMQRLDALEGINLLRRSQIQQQLHIAFNLSDVNNYGTQQLLVLLENLDIYEPMVATGLRLYAQRRGLPANNMQVTDQIASAILGDLMPSYGPGLTFQDNPVQPPLPELANTQLQIVESTTDVAVSDGTRQIRFKKHIPVGVSTVGFHSIEKFVESNQNKLVQQLDLTQSALAVVKAVAENEGRLDGINTYDKGFLSFGIFQWTLGGSEAKGELPALLKKIKALYPATFRTYFSDYGINVTEDTDTTYGFITYNGSPVKTSYLKDQFRDPSWAFRFWRAGQEADVQAVQVEHAIGRLKNFYWKPNSAVQGYNLNQLITSSYGVALLLDNHVNKPSWVSKCLDLGLMQAGVPVNPATWTDADEQQVLASYLQVRETYQEKNLPPMTESRLRATKIYRKVQEGKLSDRRGSFQISELAMRSAFVESPTAYDSSARPASLAPSQAVLPPPYYAPQDYPDIEMED